MKNHAFTLIELLVVVLIIGILAAIALPQYQKAVARSRAVQAMVTLQAITQAQKEYYLANGVYSGNKENLSISFDDSVSCKDNNTYVNCFIQVAKANISFDWIGYHALGYRWECRAPKNDTLANQLCLAYKTEGGGTGGYSQNDTNFYYISPSGQR